MTAVRGGPIALVLGSLGIVAAGLGACGSDETTTSSTTTTRPDAASSSRCVESFNSRAPETLPRLARLAHKRGNDLLVGIYDGPAFSARVYDDDLASGDPAKAAVSPGACVVTEVTGGLGTLYLFAVADDGDWHNFSVTDPAVAAAKDPGSELTDVERATLSDAKPPAVPRLVPAG